MSVRCPSCRVVDSVRMDAPTGADSGLRTCVECGASFRVVLADDTTWAQSETAASIAQYRLLSVLGTGAFGTVWRARDTRLDREVALKVPRGNGVSAAERDLLFREARAAAQLRHPNIVGVYEVGQIGDGSVFVASQYIPGIDLKRKLQGQPVSANEAARLCFVLASAVEHAHRAGVIHRDLKPSNILIDLEGQPHILDFGLALRDAGEATVTVDGAILGTPAYMSPEQASGRGHFADARSDVYSLGVTLYELLTGQTPFQGDPQLLVYRILTEEPLPPSRIRGGIPADIETICLKCLRKEPHRRYRTARELAEDLQRFLDGEPIRARPVSRLERWASWCRRRPAIAGLVGAVALLLLLVAAVSAVGWRATRHALQRESHARATAEQRLDELRRVLEGLGQIAESDLEYHPEWKRGRLEMLLAVRDRLAELQREFPLDPILHQELAAAYARLANFHAAVHEPAAAQAAISAAVERYEEHLRRFVPNDEVAGALAGALHNQARLTMESGNPVEAFRLIAASIEKWETLRGRHPDNPAYVRQWASSTLQLALFRYLQAEIREAIETARRAQHALDRLPRSGDDWKKTRPMLVPVMLDLANWYDDLREYETADACLQLGLDHSAAHLEAFPDDLDARRVRATLLNTWAVLWGKRNRVDLAAEKREMAIQIAEDLRRRKPQETSFASLMGMLKHNLARNYNDLGDLNAARRSIDEAMQLRRDLAAQFSELTNCQTELANTLSTAATICANDNDLATARSRINESVALFRQLADQGRIEHRASAWHQQAERIFSELTADETNKP